MEIIKRCTRCGFPLKQNSYGRLCCPMCGFNGNAVVFEATDSVDNTTEITRLLSEGDNYYEYVTNSSPFREDFWGAYYLGKCYSKIDSRLLKEVVICAVSYHRYYVYSMWELIKNIHFSEISQTAFIPIVDLVDDYGACYLVEDFFDGVSLYDLMHGHVCGVDGQPFDFAVEMFDMYQNNKTDFAKTVIKKILKGIKFIHDNNIPLAYIELPENIIFTKNREIKIRLISSLVYSCEKPFAVFPEEYDVLLPIEYISPENSHEYIRYGDERSEIYTVGVFIYCILTGHMPYKGGASIEDCHCVHSPIIDPREDNYVDKPVVSCYPYYYGKFLLDEIEDKHLKTIITKATRLNPDKRYQSAQEFIDALEDNANLKGNIPWYKKIFSFFHNKKKGLPCILLSTLFSFFYCPYSEAQNIMRINYKDGNISEVPIEQIDSITFVDKEEETHEATLIGEWLWGNVEQGYYELLKFNEDKTYTGYDNYFTYGFDTMTYGFYSQYGTLLTLWSNGFGYQHRYQWFITGLSGNELSVMTKMGPFTYYRLQDEVIHLKVSESMVCTDGESLIFADGKVAGINENKLYGISQGITYIQKHVAGANLIYSYKVVVE